MKMFVQAYIKIITKFVNFTLVSIYFTFREMIIFTKNIEVICDYGKTAKEKLETRYRLFKILAKNEHKVKRNASRYISAAGTTAKR